MTRLPLAPLLDAVRRHSRPRLAGDGMLLSGTALVAEACGVTKRTVQRWAQAGLTWDAADKAACSLGLHPASVFGRAWWDDVAEAVA